MKQFEIFGSHTRNFIKKKQLFPFFFFHYEECKYSWKTCWVRRKLSREKGGLSGSGERMLTCQWPSEKQRDCCLREWCFSRETLPIPATRHSPRAQPFSWQTQPPGQPFRTWSWWHCQLLSWHGLTSSTWAVEHGKERCCSAADLTSLYFPIWRQMDLLQTWTTPKISPFSFRLAFSKARLQSLYQYPNGERSASKVMWPWPCPMSRRSLLRQVNFSKHSCLCQLTFQALQKTFQDGSTPKWSEYQQEIAHWLCLNFKGVPIQIAHKSCSSNPTEPE